SLDVDNGPLVTTLLGSLSDTALGEVFKAIKTKVNTHTCYHYPGLLFALKNLPPPLAAAGLVFLNDPEFGAYLLECLHEITGSRVLDAMVRLDIKPKLSTTNRTMAAKIWSELEFIERSDDTDANPNLGNKSGIVLYMTYEAAVGMLLAKENGSNINSDLEIINNFNALVDDETVVNGLEYVVTPLLAEVYKGGDTRGQGIVDTYLQQNIGDDQLGDVFFGDRNDALNQPLFDRASITNTAQQSTAPDDVQRRTTATFPPDIGIITDQAQIDSYNTPFALQPNPNDKTIFEGTGKLVDGNPVALIDVEATDGFDAGKRAVMSMTVGNRNGTTKNAFVVVDPTTYQPITDDNNNIVIAQPNPETSSSAWRLQAIQLQQIQTATDPKLDIMPAVGGILSLPKKDDGTPYTFEEYQVLRNLDTWAMNVPKTPYDQTATNDTADIPPNALDAVRGILKKVAGGVGKATQKQISDLKKYIYNNSLSNFLKPNEKAFILKIINPQELSSFRNQLFKSETTPDYTSFTSEMRDVVESQISGSIAAIKNDQDGLMSAIENWDNLVLFERKALVQRIVTKLQPLFEIPADKFLPIEFHEQQSDVEKPRYKDLYDKSRKETIEFEFEFIRSASAAQVLNKIVYGLFATSLNFKMRQFHYEEMPEGNPFYNYTLLYKTDKEYFDKFNDRTAFEGPTSYYNKGAYYVGNRFASYFANQSEKYYSPHDIGFYNFETPKLNHSVDNTWPKGRNHEVLWPKVRKGSGIPILSQLRSSKTLSKTEVYQKYEARIFVDKESYTIRYGVITRGGRTIWSTKIHDLQNGLMNFSKSVLTLDDKGNFIARVVDMNGNTNDVNIFPNTSPSNLPDTSVTLILSETGQLTVQGSNKTVVSTPDPDPDPDVSLQHSLLNTLAIDLSSNPNDQAIINPYQFLESAGGNYRLFIDYDKDAGTVEPTFEKGSQDSSDISINLLEELNVDLGISNTSGSVGRFVLDKNGFYFVHGDLDEKFFIIEAQPGIDEVASLILTDAGSFVLYDKEGGVIGENKPLI
ncbi:MAG: hypothetical protein AAF228_11840, partial [Pseudomonadota bacterium]